MKNAIRKILNWVLGFESKKTHTNNIHSLTKPKKKKAVKKKTSVKKTVVKAKKKPVKTAMKVV